MILVPKKNLYLPERKWGVPKFQKGIMHPIGFWAADAAGVVLGPAWNITNYRFEFLSTCSVTFETDGSISVAQNGGTDDLPASDNWWAENPSTAVGDDYEVGYTAITDDGWDGAPGGINTFWQLNVARTYSVTVIGKNSPATHSANGVTFEIRTYPGSVSQDTVSNCNHSTSN